MTFTVASHQELLHSQGLSNESAVLIVSSCMKILYASPAGQQFIEELSESLTSHTYTPAILAYIGEGVMKHAQIQRAINDYSPVRNECAVKCRRGLVECSTIGIVSEKAIDETQIIFVLKRRRRRQFLAHIRPLVFLSSYF